MKRILKKLAAAYCSAALVLPSVAPVAVLAADLSASLNGVEVESDSVRLKLSDQVRFNVFVTAEPPRLVVELLGTEHALPARQVDGQGRVLKKVRSGQYQRDPSLITRIVLDMSQLVTYKASWEGKDLIVRLMSEGVEPSAVASADQTPASPTMSKSVPAALVTSVERQGDSMPDKMSTVPSSDLMRIARSRDASGGAGVPSVAKPLVQSGFVSGPVRRDIMATLPVDPTSLDFDNTDIREILKLMAMKAKINIVYGADVSGSLTLHVTEVPFNEAFTTILSMQGLVANQVGENILRVMTPASLARERTVAVNQTRVLKLKYSKAADIVGPIQRVRAAEQRTAPVVPDTVTNSIIVTDTLDGIASLERLLAQLDVRPPQIMIEAKIVEVKLNKDVEFGIQWDYFSQDSGRLGGQQGTNFIGSTAKPTADPPTKPFDDPATGVAGTPVGTGASGRGTGVLLPADKIFGAFTFGRVTNNYFLSATLTAAASSGKAKVLSDPKIATINGNPATINITTQIPYVTSSVTSTGVATQSVTYTQTGITLAVTPTVNADGRVTLDITPNVSQPSAIAASAGNTGAPSIDTRTAHTLILVQDGETAVIGGLITDSVNDTIAKIPILGDIPILGWLFKKKSTVRQRVELLIFVTPRIIPA